ncbi:hypothetical protein PsAD46_04508 [Pseudovibrio sp. Ad46]|uniref:hypothetical protein n=1 Tax=unclassified Pseudovibrio TaxID=2627060 RepID=UPI0007AED630|nr:MULTISPECIES: hypothetical protein [unclassified Pseudovibrio]KZK78890.1 hypothetical protein PsAD46_04508 [Pseudovibrio sp. Ad46]KZK93634.1 hypothetical protein PsAD5_02950 [Pseudovibrio sp. Ad5]
MGMLEDWKEYLNGSSHFDADDFAALLTDTADIVSPEEAFKALKDSLRLIEKTNKLRLDCSFTGLYFVQNEEKKLDRQEIHDLALSYRDNIANFLLAKNESELASQVNISNIKYVEEYETYHNLRGDRSLPWLGINDEMSNYFGDYLDQDERFYGVEEAILHLTMSPEITRYLMQELVGFPVDHTPFYKLWVGGGNVAFMEGEIILLSPTR